MTHPEVYAPAEDTWLLLRAAGKECHDGERVWMMFSDMSKFLTLKCVFFSIKNMPLFL